MVKQIVLAELCFWPWADQTGNGITLLLIKFICAAKTKRDSPRIRPSIKVRWGAVLPRLSPLLNTFFFLLRGGGGRGRRRKLWRHMSWLLILFVSCLRQSLLRQAKSRCCIAPLNPIRSFRESDMRFLTMYRQEAVDVCSAFANNRAPVTYSLRFVCIDKRTKWRSAVNHQRK